MKITFVLILASTAINAVFGQNENRSTGYLNGQNNNQNVKPFVNHIGRAYCPPNWVQFEQSCYKFIKSFRNRNGAEKTCQALFSELVDVKSFKEHGFISNELLGMDGQQKWYTAINEQNLREWANDEDRTQLLNLAESLPTTNDSIRDIVYSFSDETKHWGYEVVSGLDPLFYICEAPIAALKDRYIDDRKFVDGFDVETFGPFFTIEPTDVIFDLSKSNNSTVVEFRCSAEGHPSPNYVWYKEQYMYTYDSILILRIDPYLNKRMTMNGGSLMIHEPQETDHGFYYCRASNMFGSIRTQRASLSFGRLGEFNPTRSLQTGRLNRGKALYCNPPASNPAVNFFWIRSFLPNIIKDDPRVFLSSEGTLFFSHLLEEDEDYYSCCVKNQLTEIERTGPIFALFVSPDTHSLELRIPSGFPKVFPDVPKTGKDIRLECIAYGESPLSYKWRRFAGSLPTQARTENYNRVLIIPNATVEDGGRYVCTVFHERSAVEGFVTVSVQAEPYFTIPLANKNMYEHSDLSWVCEAFGIPGVIFTWYRNGSLINQDTLTPEFRDRYIFQDNILQIKDLDIEKDPAMFQCCAENNIGTKLSSAQLRVLPLPLFEWWVQPEKFITEEGNVTLSCNPEDSPRHKVVWTKGDKAIVTGGKMRIFENGSLLISSATPDDAGLYVCTAIHNNRREKSSEHLIVTRILKWVKPLPPNIVLTAMQNYTIECEGAFDESLNAKYVWKRNGIRLEDNERIVINEGLLHFTNINRSDGGEYECSLESDFHQITSKTHVVVHGKPGSPINVVILATNSTSATIQWKDGADNGRPISQYRITAQVQWNSTWVHIGDFANVGNSVHFIDRKEVVLNDNTLYPWTTYQFRVSAFNELGRSKPSKPSVPLTTFSDRPYKFPNNIGGGGGDIGNLTITWEPLPPIYHNGPGLYYKVFWRKYGEKSVSKSKEIKENTGIAVIPIGNELVYTKYSIRVQAINNIGNGPISPFHYVRSAEDLPRVAPQNLTFAPINSIALFVTWNAVPTQPHLIRGKLIGYRLKCWENTVPEADALYTYSKNTKTWGLIMNLKPNSYYFVKATVFNTVGHGPESPAYLVHVPDIST